MILGLDLWFYNICSCSSNGFSSTDWTSLEQIFTGEYKNGYLPQSLHGPEGNNRVSVQWNTLLYPPKWKPAAVSPLYNSPPGFFFHWHLQHPADRQWELCGKNTSLPSFSTWCLRILFAIPLLLYSQKQWIKFTISHLEYLPSVISFQAKDLNPISFSLQGSFPSHLMSFFIAFHFLWNLKGSNCKLAPIVQVAGATWIWIVA